MGKKRFTDEQKREALAKAEHYIRHGWNLKSIHKQLEAEYQAEGKEMISWWTFYPLAKALQEELRAEGKTEDANADQNGGNGENGGNGDAGSEDGPGEPEPEGPEGQPGKNLNLFDYTERLAMIVRLYRFRTEEDVDAVCDRLIPELSEVRND